MKSLKINIQIANFRYSEILKYIENQCFPTDWRKTDFLKELRKKNAIYFIAYEKIDIDQNIIKHKKSILKNKFIIGFAGIWFYEEFSEIVSIGVLKSHRRLGVAHLLISKLINHSHSKKMKIVNLEVGKKNIEAQNLYRQFGFKTNGYRKKYYLHNGDDAILMSLKI